MIVPSVLLGEATDLLTDGTHYTPPNIGEGIPFLTVKDVSDRGLDFVGCSKISSEEYETAKRQNSAPKRGDVLFSKDGTVGKVHLVREEQKFAVLSSLAILRPSKRIDGGYLAHFLRSPSTVEAAARKKTGSAIRRIVLRDLATLQIPLPPLDGQRRIAAILDKADALRRKRKRALELLDGLAKSIFTDMFIATDDHSWPVCNVESLSTNMRTGPFGSQLLHSEFVDKGVAVLGIDNAVANRFRWGERRYITTEKYHELRRYTVLPGDVVITIMGTCGRCAVVPDDIPVAINTKHLCCITLDKGKCLPEVLQAIFLQHPVVLKQLGVQAKGAVMPGLNMGIIKKLSFPLPPLELQKAFIRAIKCLTNAIVANEEAASVNDNLFLSLQHSAFSAQL